MGYLIVELFKLACHNST